MIGPTTSKAPIPPPEKRGWAFFSMEVRREKATILEEMAQSSPKTDATKSSKWVAAIQEWTIISNGLAPRLIEPPDLLTPEERPNYRTPQAREKRIAELEAKMTPEEKGKRSIEVSAEPVHARNLFNGCPMSEPFPVISPATMPLDPSSYCRFSIAQASSLRC